MMGIFSSLGRMVKKVAPYAIGAGALATGASFALPAVSSLGLSGALGAAGRFLGQPGVGRAISGAVGFAENRRTNAQSRQATERLNRQNMALNDKQMQFAHETNIKAAEQDWAMFEAQKQENARVYGQQRQHQIDDYYLQRQHNFDDIDAQFRRTRQAAESAGFNPLTALGGGGSVPSAQIAGGATLSPAMITGSGRATPGSLIGMAAPPLASTQGLAEVVSGVAEAFKPETTQKALEAQAAAISNKPEVARRTALGEVTQETAVINAPKTQAELDALMADKVYMVSITGDNVSVPRFWADEWGKGPGDTLTIEDMEKVGGDIASEILGAMNAPAVISVYFGENGDPRLRDSSTMGRISDWLLGGGGNERPVEPPMERPTPPIGVPAPPRISTGSRGRADRRHPF